MSSEHERLLREARRTLPEPDAESTRRARARALAAVRRPRPRPRRRVRAAALVTMVAAALAAGIGVGAFVAPSGTAARPAGLGFLPERGWHALQTAGEVGPYYQRVAVASNVPLDPEDQAGGLEPSGSGLPYATLLTLPARGIVIVATFARPSPGETGRHGLPKRSLPLRLADATPHVFGGTQLRPQEPLGQLELRALVEGNLVIVHVYFGRPHPTAAQRAAAQRQLDGLVLRPARPAAPSPRRPAVSSAPSAPGILDRTYTCAPALQGGIRSADVRAHRGTGKRGGSWERPAFASVSTTVSGAAATAIEDELAWITAGRPSATATVVPKGIAGFTFPMRMWGTLGINAKRCRATKTKVPLSRAGLQGGPAGTFEDRWDCATGRRVLVHVRAVLRSNASLKSFRGFLRTTVPVKSASLAVRSATGKPLAYAQVVESGKAFFYTSPSCFPE